MKLTKTVPPGIKRHAERVLIVRRVPWPCSPIILIIVLAAAVVHYTVAVVRFVGWSRLLCLLDLGGSVIVTIAHPVHLPTLYRRIQSGVGLVPCKASDRIISRRELVEGGLRANIPKLNLFGLLAASKDVYM